MRDLYNFYDTPGLNQLATNIGLWRRQKGFSSPEAFEETESLMAKLMLITTEVSEAAKEVRKGDVAHFAEEMADIIIRVLDTTEALGIDIAAEIATKMETNEGRPHMHGARI